MDTIWATREDGVRTFMGIPTCKAPTNPRAIYMRVMYREFFMGPFANEDEVVRALKTLDAADPYWDYDCYCMIYGAEPLPRDFVFGFPSVPNEIRNRIELRRRDEPRR